MNDSLYKSARRSRKEEKEGEDEEERGQPELNRRPLDLQSNALPLSYTPHVLCLPEKLGPFLKNVNYKLFLRPCPF